MSRFIASALVFVLALLSPLTARTVLSDKSSLPSRPYTSLAGKDSPLRYSAVATLETKAGSRAMIRIHCLLWSPEEGTVCAEVLHASFLEDGDDPPEVKRDLKDAVGKTFVYTMTTRTDGTPAFQLQVPSEGISPGAYLGAGVVESYVLPRVVLALPSDFEPRVSFVWGEEEERTRGYDGQPVIQQFKVTDAFDVGGSKIVVIEGRAIQSPERLLVAYAIRQRTTLLDVTTHRVRFVSEARCAASFSPPRHYENMWALPTIESITIAEIGRREVKSSGDSGEADTAK